MKNTNETASTRAWLEMAYPGKPEEVATVRASDWPKGYKIDFSKTIIGSK